MPKKTKQEKVMARLRRLEQDQAQTEVVEKKEALTYKADHNLKLEAPEFSSKNLPSDSKLVLDYSYVYKDLTKSLVFAAVAVILQIILAVIFFR